MMSHFSVVVMNQARGVAGIAMLVICYRAVLKVRSYRVRFFTEENLPFFTSQKILSSELEQTADTHCFPIDSLVVRSSSDSDGQFG